MRAGAAAAELGCGCGLASAWAGALGQRELEAGAGYGRRRGGLLLGPRKRRDTKQPTRDREGEERAGQGRPATGLRGEQEKQAFGPK